MKFLAKRRRYTLRKEYFGGILHDAKTLNIELLSQEEYDFLLSIVMKKSYKQKAHDKQRVSSFLKKGFISKTSNNTYTSEQIRAIPQIKFIRKNVLSAPIRVFDSFTRYCNFECKHCYFTSGAMIKEKRRTIEQTKDILKKFYEAGTMEWRFTGGEALTQPDIYEAISYAKLLGMNVGLYSNGWWSDTTAEKVFSLNLDEIVLSLEGSRLTNDKRRRKGGYNCVVSTIKRIHKHNVLNPSKKIKGIIATAVGQDNIKDISFLVKLAASFNFDINFMPLKPSGRARYTLSDEFLSSKEYLKFAKTVQKLRENNDIKKTGIKITLKYKDLFCDTYEDKSNKPFPFNYAECGALTKYISMMPDGQVFSCPFILDVDTEGKYLGPNMINSSVEDAWFNPNFELYRNAEKIGCTDCKFFMKQCRGKCRATVLGYGGKISDGKLIGDDPQCFVSLL